LATRVTEALQYFKNIMLAYDDGLSKFYLLGGPYITTTPT